MSHHGPRFPLPLSGQSRDRYERYKAAGTLDLLGVGATRADIRWDYGRSFFFGPERAPTWQGVVGEEVEKICGSGEMTWTSRIHGLFALLLLRAQ